MAGVVDGTPVNAFTTNTALLAKNGDDATVGRLALNNALAESGSSVSNPQRELNALWSFLGDSLGNVYNYLTTWSSTNFGSNPSSMKAKINAIDAGFSSTGSQVSRSGRVAIPISADSVSVTLSSALPSSDYVIDHSIENLTDTNLIFLQCIVTARSLSGFSITFNAPVDTGNYVLHYQVRKPQ